MIYAEYLFFAISVLVLVIGMISPVSIGLCAIVAVVLVGLGAFIDIKRRQIR